MKESLQINVYHKKTRELQNEIEELRNLVMKNKRKSTLGTAVVGLGAAAISGFLGVTLYGTILRQKEDEEFISETSDRVAELSDDLMDIMGGIDTEEDIEEPEEAKKETTDEEKTDSK